MKISPKNRKIINRLLGIAALLIVIISLVGIQTVIQEIANNERNKVRIWASSVQQKAQLIAYTQEFFDQIEAADRHKLRLWGEAYSQMLSTESLAEFEFYSQMVQENTTIPAVITDQRRRILYSQNTDINRSRVRFLEDSLLTEYSQYPPIRVRFGNQNWYVYYKQSEMFQQLRQMLDEVANSFMTEVVDNSIFVPILVVSADEQNVILAGNMPSLRYADSTELQETLHYMRAQNAPIEFSTDGNITYLIFCENPSILDYLMYLPLILFALVMILVFITIWILRTSKRLENEKLLVGMSRETAHQLGTPLSSLMGWAEYMKIKRDMDDESIAEIEKDIDRLKTITDRFSKIGSAPKMTEENVVRVVYDSISYLQRRLSQKIKFNVNTPPEALVSAKINAQLMGWVLENLFKNAVDVIGTHDGLVQIDIFERKKSVIIDITDNGKGLSKDKWEMVFEAGYTTKQRGWGLGLTLTRRIVNNYHKGRIFVKHSVMDEGTTFRIILNK